MAQESQKFKFQGIDPTHIYIVVCRNKSLAILVQYSCLTFSNKLVMTVYTLSNQISNTLWRLRKCVQHFQELKLHEY